MEATEPCNICGCTQTNLVDGFYYCAECGTQDTNVRETVVEYTTLGDGALALGTKRRIKQIPQTKEVEMTDDWYNWHTMNFLLQGLADELIEIGAAPTFKTKLLWVWTRYMKKYQNKADFGLEINEESDGNEEDKPPLMENAYSSDEEEENVQKKPYKFDPNIERISMPLVISLLYVSLNIDRSPIQLTHLLRFMREGRVSILQWQKLVPQEMRPKKLRKCLFFDYQCFRFSTDHVRILGLEIFRKLDLGDPIVPDLRLLVDEYLKELCLPNDLKPLVFSLMHFRSFDYLDTNVKYKDVRRIPSYELHAMSHLLMAIKICFGLDCEYELKLSDAVDKINDLENHPKSYNSRPTERLFSFREWCSYIQFRKASLRAHTLHLGAPNYFDMNDYVAFEHLKERPDYKINLKDEIAMDIINKIPSGEVNVIPREEFIATTTPHSDCTRIILEHQQDPNVKKLLGEDFTQYSLKYIMKDMFLVDPDSVNPKNILTGVSETNLQESKMLFEVIDHSLTFAKGMVYVKDCDNHNWMITQRPLFEHITKAEKIVESDEENNYLGSESNSETFQNVTEDKNVNPGKTVEINENDDTNTLISVTDVEMEAEKKSHNDNAIVDKSLAKMDKNILGIEEEVDGENIFDDDFANLESKKEEEKEPDYNDNELPCEVNQSFHFPDRFEYDGLTQNYWTEDKSDVSSVDSLQLNPESLDRMEAIKELVIHACNKYKISLPGQYIHVSRKTIVRKKKTYGKIERPRFAGETKLKINDLVAAYHSHIQNDILHQMSNMVQSAIAQFNGTKEESEIPKELEDPPRVDDEIDAVSCHDQTTENEPINIDKDPNQNETTIDDNKHNLFGDSSDGETQAEELLPKKNPQFDEKNYDIRQLYLKTAEDPTVPEIELNPKLFQIIDQQLVANDKGTTILEQSSKQIENSDSEEEVCLSVLQEQRRIRKQLTEQATETKNKHLKRLIRGDVLPYNYWTRHYKQQIASLQHLNQRFANEIDVTLPKSFVFVLKECADVLGYPPFNLYKSLQRIEGCLIDKYVNRKRFRPSYFAKAKRYKRNQEWL